jgi:hypothetical protein
MDVAFFFEGRRGGRFGFRFRTCPSARCALRAGEGPRALGFSMLAGKLEQKIRNCESGFSRNWRGHSDRLSFTNGFGNDRVTWAYY